MALPFPIPSTKPKGDTKGDEKGIPETGKKGLSLSVCIVKVLRSEPDRAFVVRDLVDRTGGNYPSVKRVLSRLSVTGKGSGPVRRVRHGIYQYAPEKEQDSLRALARSGNWKVENLTFVRMGAYPTPVSVSETQAGAPQTDTLDPTQSTPHPNIPFPWKLDTGQLVTWEDYQNGTQVIRISANGAPPISPDAVLLIIGGCKNFGMDDSWTCTSLELNVDTRKLRIDSSYSLQLIEGVILKAYQHGYNTRVEVADRRKVPVREVLELFHAIAGGIDGKETIAKVRDLEPRVERCEKSARLALSVATSVRDRQPSKKSGSGQVKKAPAPGFRTGAEIFKGKVTGGAGKQGAEGHE